MATSRHRSYKDVFLTSVLKKIDVAVKDTIGKASTMRFTSEEYIGTSRTTEPVWPRSTDFEDQVPAELRPNSSSPAGHHRRVDRGHLAEPAATQQLTTCGGRTRSGPHITLPSGGLPVKLELRNITKKFSDFRRQRGHLARRSIPEIVALLGERRAGKEPLMNVVTDCCSQHRGDLCVNDERAQFDGPGEAIAAGIGMVHQHWPTHPPSPSPRT